MLMAKMVKAARPKWRRTFIREWRLFRQMTLADLALAMDMNEGYLSELENGNRRYNQSILESAAKILKVPEGYLLSRKPTDGESDLDYSDPYVAAPALERIDERDRQRIGTIIKSYQDETVGKH